MRNRYGVIYAESAYNFAIGYLRSAGFDEAAAIVVLDSRCGRHWADAVKHPAQAQIEKAARPMQSWLRFFARGRVRSRDRRYGRHRHPTMEVRGRPVAVDPR